MARVLCSTGALIGKPNGRDYRLLEPLSKQLECDGYEFMMYPDWYGQMDDIVALIKRNGISVPAFHAQKGIGEKITAGGQEDTDEALTTFKINVEMAAKLGAEKIVLHLWDGLSSDSCFQNNLNTYAELRGIADAAGIMLLVENVVCNVQDPWTHWQQLVKHYPDVRFVFDTKMAAFHGQTDELYKKENAFLMDEGHIRHFHVNDYAGGYMDWNNLKTLAIGNGHIDFETFFAFIREKGYNDTFTLESTAFDRMTGVVDTDLLNREIRYVREQLARE